jgi:hypothetical protein
MISISRWLSIREFVFVESRTLSWSEGGFQGGFQGGFLIAFLEHGMVLEAV